MTAELKAILESHSLPALKKFVRDSNLSVGTLKRAELIALMIKNKSRFGHIKPDESRYKRGKEKPKKVEGRARGRPRKTPLKRPALKKPVLVTPINKLSATAKWTPRTPMTSRWTPRTPMTPALKTPRTPALKTPRPRNPLRDVQFRSNY